MDKREKNEWDLNDFVTISVTWLSEEICRVLMMPACNFSLIKWQFNSTFSWNIELAVICNVAWLSHNYNEDLECNWRKFESRERIQVISHTTHAIDLYSTSTNDLEIVVCFFDFQNKSECPRKTQKVETDLLILVQLA